MRKSNAKSHGDIPAGKMDYASGERQDACWDKIPWMMPCCPTRRMKWPDIGGFIKNKLSPFMILMGIILVGFATLELCQICDGYAGFLFDEQWEAVATLLGGLAAGCVGVSIYEG